MNGSYPTIWSSEHRCLTQAPTISFHLTFKHNTTERSQARGHQRENMKYILVMANTYNTVSLVILNTTIFLTISMKIKHFKVIGGLLLLSGTVYQALYRNYLNIFNDSLLNLPILVFLIGMMTCCVSLLGLLGSSQRQRWKGS